MSKVKELVFGAPRLEYLKCVMEDPELKLRVSQIHKQVDVGKDNRFTFEMDGDHPVPYIGSNPVRKINEEIIQEIGKLEIDFELGSRETISLLNGELPEPEGQGITVFFSTDDIDAGDDKLLRLYILGKATKRDILNALEGVEERVEEAYGVKAKRRMKGPENYQLVYAIHRARRKGLSFSEIFIQYGLGTLPNYKGSRAISTLDKFREYYRKYEPKEPRRGMWVLDADSTEFTEGRGFLPPAPPG